MRSEATAAETIWAIDQALSYPSYQPLVTVILCYSAKVINIVVDYRLSIHIDRPDRLRVAGIFSAAMAEVTHRTKATFGSTIIGYHRGDDSRYVFFASVAHQRGPDGKFLQPANPDDQLYDDCGKALTGAMVKSVPGLLIDARGRRADDHGLFMLSPERYDAVQSHIEEVRMAPGLYNGVHNNCVRFALTTLEVAGIALDTGALRHSVARLRHPEDVSAALQNQPQTPGRIFHTAIPKLLG